MYECYVRLPFTHEPTDPSSLNLRRHGPETTVKLKHLDVGRAHRCKRSLTLIKVRKFLSVPGAQYRHLYTEALQLRCEPCGVLKKPVAD